MKQSKKQQERMEIFKSESINYSLLLLSWILDQREVSLPLVNFGEQCEVPLTVLVLPNLQQHLYYCD